MEYAQLESRISFLDNEFRREKAETAQLRHQLDLSEAERDELNKRVESLETELLDVKSALLKVGKLEAVIDRFKGEMMSVLEEQRLAQKRALRDAEHTRSIELESHIKIISDLRKEMERGRNLDELISLARTETDRQGAVQVSFQQRLDNLAKQNDERVRSVAYLEEQRRTDGKNIAQLKAETTDMFKRLDLQLAKVELLEQQIPQFGQFQTELAKINEKVRAEVEKSQYQQGQVARYLKSWDELSASVQRRLAEFESRMERYAEQYQRNLKALESLQGFQEQLKRGQHEFMELHRLNTDRRRTQFETWQSAQEQTLRKAELETEQRLAEMLRRVEKVQENLKTTANRLPGLKAQLELLLKATEEDVITRALAARDWQTRFEELILVENKDSGADAS